MERLFRPWRLAYVSAPKEGPAGGTGCFLCDAAASTDDAASLVVAREPAAFVVLNRYPYNSGHVMVVPTRHIGDLELLTVEERMALMDLLIRSLAALKVEMTPDGCNVGINIGRAAGAGAPDHLHIHAVPRWSGDTNFMPLFGDTMVLPEGLESTRERLARRMASAAP